MALPVVAIIGRPNVGKSSLLNALSGHMISIVEPTAGVTRDRVSTIIGRDDQYFELNDTGGYGIVDSDLLSEHIEHQIHQAIESANLVLFMVDIRDGIVPLDKKIAQLLRKHDLDVIGVANKADSAKMFPAAIVGKRNAGKSTLVNAMVGSERVIVSETPGTTRDAVDVRFEKDGKTIIVIDTAGVRKKNKMADSIEFYSYVRATRSIQRADVVLFLIDAAVPVSQVDKKLAKFIAEEYKSCIMVINKWDLAKDSAATEDYEDYLTKLLPGLRYAPLAFTTATEGRNIQSVLDLSAEIFKQTMTWIPTARLNKAFDLIKQEKITAAKRGKKGWPKIYYATQVAVNPITFLMFVNRPELFEENYRRFIVNRLRSILPIDEVPIRLFTRKHRE